MCYCDMISLDKVARSEQIYQACSMRLNNGQTFDLMWTICRSSPFIHFALCCLCMAHMQVSMNLHTVTNACNAAYPFSAAGGQRDLGVWLKLGCVRAWLCILKHISGHICMWRLEACSTSRPQQLYAILQQ